MSFQSPWTMYRDACQKGYALGAFNVYSLESMLAVMEAAEEERSPAIIQVSMGARKYVRHLAPFVQTIRLFGQQYDAPFYIQHDHCTTLQQCREAIEAGVQAVMFDGSHLPYEENIARTRQVCEMAHGAGVWVEAELGCLPGFEDLIFSSSAVYTDPELVPDFIRRSGCDALAVAVGTSHGGVQAPGDLPLDLERLRKIAAAVPGFPLVLHGAASLPAALIDACNATGMQVQHLHNCSEESICAAVSAGVRKANMDVDNSLAFTTAARASMAEQPELYDPRKYLAPAADAFKREVAHKMRDVMLSSGRY